MKLRSILPLAALVTHIQAFTPQQKTVLTSRLCADNNNKKKRLLDDFDSFKSSVSKESNLPNLDDVKERLSSLGSIFDNAGAVKDNIMSGELGQRGELYVVAQFAVIVGIAAGGVPVVGTALNVVIGPLLILVGLVTMVLAVQEVGPGLSPWPAVTRNSRLVTTGPLFGQVRHPIYAGLLALCLGFSLVTGSATRLLLTALLWYIVELKTEYEEQDLIANFPVEYPEYQADVTNKFVPRSLLEVLPWTARE